ncbi:MAG: hypothetical protein QXU97_00280 [Fervidicoccaceae archaeon]
MERGIVAVTEEVGAEYVEELGEKYSELGVEVISGAQELLAPNFVSLREAYDAFADLLLRRLSRRLALILERSSRRGSEHALIIPKWSRGAIELEGERDKIVLPELGACVFAHTHPAGSCLPSRADLSSTYSFFANGGIIELILSPECSWSLRRIWMLGEEDLEALLALGDHRDLASLRGVALRQELRGPLLL